MLFDGFECGSTVNQGGRGRTSASGRPVDGDAAVLGRGAAGPTVTGVRWDALFADLEAQLDAAVAAGDDVAGLVRAEVARTDLADRLRAHAGAAVVLRLTDGQWLRGAVLEAAPQWLLLAEGATGEPGGHPLGGSTGRQVLVPLTALERVGGLSRAVAPPPGAVERRLGLGAALRALSRDRVPVGLLLAGGALSGTIDRVGADHLDLAVHPAGEARRAAAVTEVAVVPFAALLGVRSGAGGLGAGGPGAG
jgi:hypothetical protein